MRTCPEDFDRRIKEVDQGLSCIWNGMFRKWQILHKSKNGMTRKVFFLDREDTELPEPAQHKLVYRLKTSIRWDLVNKHNNVNDMLDEIDSEARGIKKKADQDFNNMIWDLNKDEEYNWAKVLGTGRTRVFQNG